MARQDDYTRYTVRIPGPLYERVVLSAEAGQRSINAEIVATLEEKYPAPDPQEGEAVLRELLQFVEAAADGTDAGNRAQIVNQILAASPTLRRYHVEIRTAEGDQGTNIELVKAAAPGSGTVAMQVE